MTQYDISNCNAHHAISYSFTPTINQSNTILRSTALQDVEVTDIHSDVSSQNSLFNASNLDQTAYALHRVIVDSLSRN